MSESLEQLLDEGPARTRLAAVRRGLLARPAPGTAPRDGLSLETAPADTKDIPVLEAAPATASEQPQPAADLTAVAIHKSYRKGQVEVPVLRGLSLEVRRGEFLAIVGQSGSGKSTLLHLLGTLDVPDRGQICFQGKRIDNLSAGRRDRLRNRNFGMIFQFYHLLPELTTLENVLMPLWIRYGGLAYLARRRRCRAAAAELLDLLGLGHRLKHRPRELSGGEMQRAAIARSLIARPTLLLADEPTGNLDQDTGGEIIQILRALNERQRLTIVMVTHDPAIAGQADRIVRLAGGSIV
jgi:lipoprotein-releasing system ATP-binding protein